MEPEAGARCPPGSKVSCAHTARFTTPSRQVKPPLAAAVLGEFRTNWERENHSPFLASFEDEGTRAAEVATMPLPTWSQVERELAGVLQDVMVVVDNGSSDDRLDYNRTEDGAPIAETVIAVGGGTLSRGLTLEGLVVSYFTRTSNTYDTLLQMGRWLGYRSGYEDLPRIWMQPSLAMEFKFLSLVEEEIRQDMHHMERMKVSPRELGVRVRAHPGRLAIVARNKMQHATIVRISYSGERNQTFIFDETDPQIVAANRNAVIDFLTACQKVSPITKTPDTSHWSFTGIPADRVVSFINSYKFHPDQAGMRSDHMAGWIQRAAPDNPWNVVVIGSDRVRKRRDGSVITLGSVDLGLGQMVPAVNRAPLINPPKGTANIKALLSHDDWFADLDPEDVKTLGEMAKDDPRGVRRKLSSGRGLVIVYPISKDSIPMRTAKGTQSRREMQAADHLLGIGLIFPDVERDGLAESGTYYSVHPDWEVAVSEDDDDLPEDREDSLTVDGEKVAPKS
jgi:hypothetical protein